MTLALTAFAASAEPPSPGPKDFDLPAVFHFGEFGVTKPMLLVVLSLFVIVGLFSTMARPAAVVPGRMQFAGELVYGFVRNGIARENIGSAEFMRFVPYLFTIFLFVLVNNFYGLFPFLQFPSMSHIGYPLAIAILSWLVYNGAGIKKKGFLGYLKHETVPGGMKGPILLLLVPLEFLSNILLRPITLTLRLFATMFAGHLLLILFSLGGSYLLLHSDNSLALPAGLVSSLLAIAISFLEILIMFLQAYVFTLLSSMYIGEALADEH
ncbi:F0F1 ATP synthase subunit A [Aeromicrobium sp. Root344]|uniref:F0F1 ATP synthase subunit A n=1 Tax=Aeromicrobium sp. Root344 TaxID=1736521 RepID=UPI0009E70C5B|nr:F0F1 ATP synthase subunit A [Aeromicrobium sp. Root344]